MKKILTYFSAALAVAALSVGCNKEHAAIEGPAPLSQEGGILLTLDATRGGETTKTAMSEDENYHALESIWSAGDQVYVFKLDGTYLGTLTVDSGSITNQKTSETAQWRTSYAQFQGTVSEVPASSVRFIYMGSGNSRTTDAETPDGYANPCISIPMGTSATVEGLNKWDFAVATGTIQGTAEQAYCASNFSNKLSFGYFQNQAGKALTVSYHDNLYYDIASNSFVSTLGVANFTVPYAAGGSDAVAADGKFYMPLVPNEAINWNVEFAYELSEGVLSGSGYNVYPTFTPSSTGAYYRLGAYNADAFGPVKIAPSGTVVYNTIKKADAVFEVADGKTVRFTEGNLQYIYNNGDPYWRVAPSQFSYLASATHTADATHTNYIAARDIDLFGWGNIPDPDNDNLFLGKVDNNLYNWGLTTSAGGDLLSSINRSTYKAGADWAVLFNDESVKLYVGDIKMGGNRVEYPIETGKKYAVLTQEEWTYLFQHQYWAHCTVNMTDGSSAKTGIVVFPAGSNFDTEEECQALGNGSTKIVRKLDATQGCKAYGDGKITDAESHSQITGLTNAFNGFEIDQDKIESNGLLFLPAAGYRNGFGGAGDVGSDGRYWSATSSSATNAFCVDFYTTRLNSASSLNRYYGRSVRLASVVSE